MRIALIAHDKKKAEIIKFAQDNELCLAKNQLFATGTTGKLIIANTSLKVHCFKSGPLGGDQEVGAQVANGGIDLVIFFRDPLSSLPHEPDINALLRLCDVYDIPLATNLSTAKMFIRKDEKLC